MLPPTPRWRRWPVKSASRLHESARRLVTAESCTGGWIAKLCTDIAGSSDWFDCGFVCYSNAAKTRDLGVPEKLIETEGAVSDAVVRAMAEGAIARTGANVAIAVSGIAGPGGAVPGKPVGTVWFALAQKHGGPARVPGPPHPVRRRSRRGAPPGGRVRAQPAARAATPASEACCGCSSRCSPTPEQNAALVEPVAPLVTQLEAQPVPAENLHATLCFIGAVGRRETRRAAAAAARVRGRPVDAALRCARVSGRSRRSCARRRATSDSAPARDLSSATRRRPRSPRDFLRTSNRFARI